MACRMQFVCGSEALHRAGTIASPEGEEPWSVTGLLDGPARSEPEAEADLLVTVLRDADVSHKNYMATHYEVSSIGWSLGPAGHRVIRIVVAGLRAAAA